METLDEIPIFTTKVRRGGNSLEVTIDSKVAQFEGIEEGDFVKIIIKKLTKEK